MKKVVHFIHSLSTGGAETLVKDYVLGLSKDKFDVSIVCYSPSNTPYEKLVTEAGIPIRYICDRMPFWGKGGALGKLFNHYLFYLKAGEVLREEKPDIVHLHLDANQYVRYAGLPENVRLFYTVHNELNQNWNSEPRYQRDLKAAKWLAKHRQMRFITLHDQMRQEVNDLFHVDNTIVLNNGIDFSRFEAARDKTEVRANLGIPQDAFVMGHVGRFSEQKNHAFLVELFSRLCRMKPNPFLLLVGDGPLKEEIQQRLMEDCCTKDRFLILSNRTDVQDLMNSMDVFCFPSVFEGLGIVLIEAQKAGLPCVASDAVPEAANVTGQVTYLSLEEGAEVWAEELYRKAENFSCHTQVPAQWDMKQVIKKLEDIYENKC